MSRFKPVAVGIAAAALLLVQGCYTAPTAVPVQTQRSIQERFEASWQAARGAASDANVRVTHEDRGSGTLQGEQGVSRVSISVVPQADQTIQVGFTVTGGTAAQD